MMLFVLLNSTSVVVKVKRVSVKSPLTFLQFINLAVVYGTYFEESCGLI